MHLGSVGGNYLKAQMQNNKARVRCDLYQREITKKHVHSLATINKNIRDMQDFLKDIKANSGYCQDVEEFSELYRTHVSQAGGETARRDGEIAQVGCSSLEYKTSALSERIFGSQTSALGQPTRIESNVDEVEKTKRYFVSEPGCALPAKSAIRTGKVLGHESSRKDNEDERDWKAAQWLVGDENLMETDGRNSSSTNKTSESGANKLNSEFKDSQENKMQRSRTSLQIGKNAFNGEEQIHVQNAENRPLEGKMYKSIYQPSDPRGAWTDRPLNKRDSPVSLAKAGLSGAAAMRSQTAPAKASRLKSQVKSASVSERKFDFTERSATAKSLSSSELKKVKIHVTLSKTERRRILQELICNSTVAPDRSFLERERQTLLKDKISKFFDSLPEQADKVQGKDEDDIFSEEEEQK